MWEIPGGGLLRAAPDKKVDWDYYGYEKRPEIKPKE